MQARRYFLLGVIVLTIGAGCTPAPENPNDEEVREGEQALCRDTCGNGTCEEIVCLGSGCPCAETAQSCPQDCSE